MVFFGLGCIEGQGGRPLSFSFFSEELSVSFLPFCSLKYFSWEGQTFDDPEKILHQFSKLLSQIYYPQISLPIWLAPV